MQTQTKPLGCPRLWNFLSSSLLAMESQTKLHLFRSTERIEVYLAVNATWTSLQITIDLQTTYQPPWIKQRCQF